MFELFECRLPAVPELEAEHDDAVAGLQLGRPKHHSGLDAWGAGLVTRWRGGEGQEGNPQSDGEGTVPDVRIPAPGAPSLPGRCSPSHNRDTAPHWPKSSFGGFPGSSAGKKSSSNAGDPGSIPGLGRPPGEAIGYPLLCSWASLVAQLVKNLPAVRETWVRSLGWEDPLKKGTATHSNILAWRIPWTV